MTSALRLVIPLILIACAQSFFPFTRSAEKEPELDTNSIRGVPPYKLSQYESDVLVCDNGQKTYTKNMLNDGYCDCVDGSDEPGTSGCNGNVFYCLNKGYRIIEIPSSRVDDGKSNPEYYSLVSLIESHTEADQLSHLTRSMRLL
jgi:Glucosidase II beta subunit-like